MTIVEFLRAVYDEEAAAARAAGDDSHSDRWRDEDGDPSIGINMSGPLTVADHIARHDPARVLAEIEAKRRIVEHCEPDALTLSPGDDYVLRLLALPHADRPDYDETWRP